MWVFMSSGKVYFPRDPYMNIKKLHYCARSGLGLCCIAIALNFWYYSCSLRLTGLNTITEIAVENNKK